MKKLIAALICFVPLALLAQSKPPRAERIEALKIGFLTKRLDLTPEEAKNFWPVYNKFQDELDKLHKQRRETLRNPEQNLEGMSDADLEKLVDSELAMRQSELDIFKKYHPQFKQVLPIRKVAILYRSEEDFKRKLLEMIRNQREGGGGRDGRDGF